MPELDYVGPSPLILMRKRTSLVRIGLRLYHGRKLVDFRTWLGDGSVGTREGISLPVENLRELIGYLIAAEEAIAAGAFETCDIHRADAAGVERS